MLKSFLRTSGYILAGAAFLILFYAAIVSAAWWVGKTGSAEIAEAEFSAENQRQIELAQQDIANDNGELAVKRLRFLNERIPDDDAVVAIAVSLTAMAEVAVPTRELPTPPILVLSGGSATATATPTATPTHLPATPVATPTDLPSPATPRPERIEQQLQSIESAIESERWELAISELTTFQLNNPSYERFYTDSLLFEAYVGGGFAFTNSSRVTLGINYFEQAEKLGELPEEAVSQLYYSRVYLTAMSYYGIDWPRSVNRLAEVCRLAPGFQNSCNLLFNARSAWGDQLLAADDSCAAAEQYRLALTVGRGTETSQSFNTAQWSCQNATPTPWSSGP